MNHKLFSVKIVLPGPDGMDDCQQFLLVGWIIFLGCIELPALVGDWLLAMSLVLCEDCAHAVVRSVGSKKKTPLCLLYPKVLACVGVISVK